MAPPRIPQALHKPPPEVLDGRDKAQGLVADAAPQSLDVAGTPENARRCVKGAMATTWNLQAWAAAQEHGQGQDQESLLLCAAGGQPGVREGGRRHPGSRAGRMLGRRRLDAEKA